MKPFNASRLLVSPFDRFSPVLGLGDARPFRETDFLPAALEIIERPASPSARLVALSMSGFVTIAIVWASVGKLDIIATAPGSILPVGNSKVIQPFETAVVRGIRVTDGQHVKAGQELIQLDAVSAMADRDKAVSELAQVQLEIARLEGLRQFIRGAGPELVHPPVAAPAVDIEAARASLRAEAAEQQAKLAGLAHQIVEKTAEAAEASETIAKLKASLPVATEQEEVRRRLKDQGYGNTFDWMASKEHLIEEQHGIPAAEQHRAEAVAQSEALKRQIEQSRAEFEKKVLGDLATAQQKEGALIADRDKGVQRVSLLTLKAPITGTVQQLAVHTLGGVVTPAQTLMVLAPDAGGLVVEAHVQNKDIGFVHEGQEAQVKIETFSFTRYGLVPGRVLDVSRDAELQSDQTSNSRAQTRPVQGNNQDDENSPNAKGYVTHVALQRGFMKTETGTVSISPGMKVTVEIKTGQRNVLSYLTSPVFRLKYDSLRER